MTAPLDVLVVGGGPAGLATAIRLKQQLAAAGREASVAVIDKAPRPRLPRPLGRGLRAACLDELVPGWRDDRRFMEHVVPVERDELYFLLGGRAIQVPAFVVPSRMHHTGDVTLSLSRLVDFLATKAERLGVELYHGYSARTLLLEGDRVAGVGLTDVGRDNHGGEKSNFRPAEEIRARVTVLADGSRGVISHAVPRALRRRQEPAGLLARHQGGRPVPRRQPVRQQPGRSTPSATRTRPASSAAGSSTAWARRRPRSA